jgi:hypothetical protein
MQATCATRKRSLGTLLGLVMLASGLALLIAATADARHGPVRRIRCESRARDHRYCPTDAQGRVRLERRLSKTACRRYDTWGADPDGGGIWVRNGCRAEFEVVPWDYPEHGYGGRARPRGSRPRGYQVTCKSKDFRPNYCPFSRWGRVRLERRLSDTPCREYDTWGTTGGGIWVDRGCAAVFSVR